MRREAPGRLWAAQRVAYDEREGAWRAMSGGGITVRGVPCWEGRTCAQRPMSGGETARASRGAPCREGRPRSRVARRVGRGHLATHATGEGHGDQRRRPETATRDGRLDDGACRRRHGQRNGVDVHVGVIVPISQLRDGTARRVEEGGAFDPHAFHARGAPCRREDGRVGGVMDHYATCLTPLELRGVDQLHCTTPHFVTLHMSIYIGGRAARGARWRAAVVRTVDVDVSSGEGQGRSAGLYARREHRQCRGPCLSMRKRHRHPRQGQMAPSTPFRPLVSLTGHTSPAFAAERTRHSTVTSPGIASSAESYWTVSVSDATRMPLSNASASAAAATSPRTESVARRTRSVARRAESAVRRTESVVARRAESDARRAESAGRRARRAAARGAASRGSQMLDWT